MKTSKILLSTLIVTTVGIGSVVIKSCTKAKAEEKPLVNTLKVDVQKAGKHVIPAEAADYYINNFEQTQILINTMLKKSGSIIRLPDGETFNKDAIATLLNNSNCEGVRISLGQKSDGLVNLVLQPVDKNGNILQTKLNPIQTIPSDIPATSGINKVSNSSGNQAVEVGCCHNVKLK